MNCEIIVLRYFFSTIPKFLLLDFSTLKVFEAVDDLLVFGVACPNQIINVRPQHKCGFPCLITESIHSTENKILLKSFSFWYFRSRLQNFLLAS